MSLQPSSISFIAPRSTEFGWYRKLRSLIRRGSTAVVLIAHGPLSLLPFFFLQWHVTKLVRIALSHNQHAIGVGVMLMQPGIIRVVYISLLQSAFREDNESETSKRRERSLLRLLRDHRVSRATDPRDKFIALTGLAYEGAHRSLPMISQPCLKTISDVFT